CGRREAHRDRGVRLARVHGRALGGLWARRSRCAGAAPMNRRTRYRVIVADPPWAFLDKLPGKGRGAQKHYGVMSTAAICAFELPPLDEDCWLFLWRPATHQQDALHVAASWGFRRPPGELIWRKTTKDGRSVRLGMGRGFRNV